MKAASDFVFLRLRGRAFQRVGAATEKARSPYLVRFMRGTDSMRRPCSEERRLRLEVQTESKFLRYRGAVPYSALCVSNRSLNLIL